MSRLIKELFRRNLILAWVALFHVALFIVLAVISLFDSTTILGINRWIKPMKFSASIALYAATLGWFMGYLPKARLSTRLLSWGVAVCMIVEIICIMLQSARGVTSHFNRATPFDAALFGAMGVMILVNALLDVGVLILFFTEETLIARSYLWGIRLGFAIFIIAGLEGIVMISQSSHSVGVMDGGQGVPFVSWSTEGGDLRVAHFFGLHALQVLPLAGFLFHRLSRRFSAINPVVLTWIFAVLYAFAGVLLFLQATSGRPLYAGL